MSTDSSNERPVEDAEAQAWYESRPDVQEALRGSVDRGTWVRRDRPRRKDVGDVEGLDEQERHAVFERVVDHVMVRRGELFGRLADS